MQPKNLRRWFSALFALLNPQGTGWYVSSYVFSFVLNVLFTWAAAASLGAKEFGGFTLFSTVTQFGVTIVNAGFYTSAMTKAGSHSSPTRVKALIQSRLTTSLMLFNILAASIAIPLFIIQPTARVYIAVGMLYILLTALQPLWMCQVRGEHGLFNALQVIQRACFTIPAFIALKAGSSLPWICLIYAISPIPAVLWCLTTNSQMRKILLPRYWLRRRAWKAIGATLKSESKFLFVDLIATLTASLPALIIAKTSGLSQLGGYSLAERYKSYVITVFSPINSSQYQRLCRYYLQGLYTQASILLSRYQLMVWLVAFSIAGIGAAIIPSQLSHYAGGEYADAKQAFVIFSLFIPFLTVSAGFNLLYFSTQRLTQPQQLSSVSKVVLFGLIYWAMIHGNWNAITAAATATVSSELLATLLAFLSSQHRSQLQLRLW